MSVLRSLLGDEAYTEAYGDPVTQRSPGQLETVSFETQTEADRIVDSGVDIVDRITGAPNRVRDLMDDWNKKMIDIANRFRDGAETTAEKNLKEGRISALWSRFGEWLAKPTNLAITAGGAIVLILLLRK